MLRLLGLRESGPVAMVHKRSRLQLYLVWKPYRRALKGLKTGAGTWEFKGDLDVVVL